MTYRAKQLVADLHEYAELAQANEWETPITLSDDIEAEANMIAELSAQLESKEEKLAAMNLDLVAENEQLKAEIGFWRPRAEAAEYDLQVSQVCETCEKYGEDDELCEKYNKGENECGTRLCTGYKWRGLCAENGAEHE